MARKQKDELEELSGGTYIFQEVNRVKIQPGLGIFTNPQADLTPDEDGKIPIHVRGSESFEMMRLRATKAKIDQFIQENRMDLLEEKITPESLEFASLVSSGFYTEKVLREFMGEGEEEETSTWGWSSRESVEAQDWDEQEWVIGKGWVKKEKPKESSEYTGGYKGYTGSYYGRGGGYDDDVYGGYYAGGSGSRGYQASKPKRYRTLSAQLQPLKDAVKTEMYENGLRVLENPADLTRVVALKVLEKIDVLEITALSAMTQHGIVWDIMSDIKWDLGYSSRYYRLLEHVEASVEEIVGIISAGTVKLLTEAESPERLMVDYAVLVDTDTLDAKNQLGGLFLKIADEKADVESNSPGETASDDEAEFNPSDLDRGPSDDPKKISYHHEPAMWGRLRIIEHPLTPSNDLRRKTVTYRATDCGTHIGDLARLLTDQRVFREMRSTPSGSLLVDCSSSMGMTSQDVHAVLKNVPGAVIGLYSGNGGSGVLHIIARAGKVAANLEAIISAALRMGGNVVDGPSIEWLNNQPKPRIWYSDAGVTGIKDSASFGLRAAANHLMRTGRVGRIANQKKLAGAFKFMRKETTVGPA